VLSGWVPAVVLVFGAAALALLALRPDRRWLRRTLPIAVLLAGGVTAALAVLDMWWRPFVDPVPPVVWCWVGVAVLAPVLAALRTRDGSPRRAAVAMLAAGLVVLAAAAAVNAYLGAYPTLRAALGLRTTHQVEPAQLAGVTAVAPLAGWHPPADLPAHGVVAQQVIPATGSGFPARPGCVYLPPAYLVSPRPLLPVLVQLAGQPGTPHDWLDGGRLAGQLDGFAARHGGLAPVAVMPDDLGATMALRTWECAGPPRPANTLAGAWQARNIG
jgi:hypothetical protein